MSFHPFLYKEESDMPRFVVYEIQDDQKPKKLDTVKATTHESARRKAIIGTTVDVNHVYAFRYRDHWRAS